MAGMSVQTAPLAPTALGGPIIYIPTQEWAPSPNDPPSLAPVGAAQPVGPIAGGCGGGWHRRHWRGGIGAAAFQMGGDAADAR
jgi:hypothetical protein